MADGQVARLIAEGENLDGLVKSGELDAAGRAQALERITELDRAITGRENTFSTHMGEAARTATRLVVIALCVCTILLWAIGTFFATRLFRNQIQLDNRLAASERRFRDFADVASDWYWEMDRSNRITYASERLYTLVQASPTEIIGQSGADFIRGTAVDPDAAEAALREMAQQRPFRNLILQTLPAGPASQYFSISGKPFHGRDGEFRGYRGVGADVTAQVRNEQALREAKEIAESANRAKSTFLANMSHELRTPLNAIIGFSDIIRSRMLGEDLNRYADYAHDINRSGAHLLTVINDILDLSRVEAGHGKLAESERALDAMVEEARLLLGNAPLNAGVSFVVTIPKPAPRLRVDPHKFVQILVNLLSNAFKFTPRGGYVTLGAARLEDGSLQVEVRDTGIGIAPEDIGTVLAPFGQVAAAYAREHQGTGLGVPLAKSLAELHGGTLALRSTVGEGTVVSITLPPGRVLDAPPAPGMKAAS